MKEVYYMEIYYILLTACFKHYPEVMSMEKHYLIKPLKLIEGSLHNHSVISLVRGEDDE